MSTKVSVCIPIYGVEKYIERCARSLFEQTMKEGIEFIFVNDCTKDKSIEILEKVLAEYPHRKDQVKIIHHEKNGGLVAARKTGLAHASGEYIIHCDSDDWVELDMYEKMYNAAREKNADICYCSYLNDFSSGVSEVITLPEYTNCDLFLKAMLSGKIHCSLCNKMFKKDIALSNDIHTPEYICLSEDYLRVAQMLLKCNTITSYSKPFYHYFRERQSSYTDPKAYKIEYFQGTCEIIDFLEKILSPEQKEYLANFKAITLFKAIKHNLLTKQEFNCMWRSDRKKILYAPNLHIIKRMILACAFVSYSLTSNIISWVWGTKKSTKSS